MFFSTVAFPLRDMQFPALRFLRILFVLGTVALASLAAENVPASDPRYRYEGRFDDSHPMGPVIIWQGSRIHLDFEGASLQLKFADAKGQSYFDAEIDGRLNLVEIREGELVKGATFSDLGPGRHRLTLFKRSEAAAGTVRFTGVGLSEGAQAFAPEAARYRLAMQFIGDSITAGACNEDGEKDQWEDRRTHNNARSYGALTAAAFNANYRNIAVSGMGVSIGWTNVTAREIWDRVYPETGSKRANLGDYTPDVVFINLGENDDSFTKAKNLPFPSADYTEGYVALVKSIRGAYPSAHIVILRGGMFGGAKSERLRGPWQLAVERLEQADPRVSHFVFQHWSSRHPRVADHRAMADELVAWLKRQPVMQPHQVERDVLSR